MPLFHYAKTKVSRIAPLEQKLKEDVIHRLIEENLSTFFEDLVLVARKPRIGGKEFDTLAFNSTTKAPVIIEYKRGENRSVIEQVDTYFVKLKLHRADVMILLNKSELAKNGHIDDLGEIDFDSPQIIVVAKEFTPEQREILTLKQDYLRLFRFQFYDDRIVSLEEVAPIGVLDSKSKVTGGKSGGGPYSDVAHFGMRPEIMKLYEKLDSGIRSLDSRVKPGKINKYFIGYGAEGSYFCNVSPRVNSLRVWIKIRQKPPKVSGIKLIKTSPQRRTPMTHLFQVDSEKQLKPTLLAIKAALAESM